MHWSTSGLRWRARRVRCTQRAAEGKAQVGDVVASRTLQPREIDADQRLGPERMGGFLQGLARHGVDQRLARIEMAGRVVQAQAVRRVLLDQQVAAVALGDRGHGDAGLPSLRHRPAMLPADDVPQATTA